MQFTTLTLAAAAVGSVSAVLNLTDVTFAGITVDTPFDITWGDATGSVALVLKEGNPLNLQLVSTITAGLPAPTGSFVWTPGTELPAANYAIEIIDATTTNFGNLFQLLSATAANTFSDAPPSTTTSTGTSSSTSVSASTTTSTGSSTTSTGSSSSTSAGTSTSTSTSSSSSASKTSTSTSSSSSPTTTPKNSNSAAGISSPLAMVFLSVAAMILFN